MENETRAEQLKCESELKNISVSLNGTHRLLDKEYKELKRKIDHLNENIENVNVLFKLEKGRFNEIIEKQIDYIEIIYSILSEKRFSHFYLLIFKFQLSVGVNNYTV